MPFKQTKLAAVAYLLPALVFLPLIGVAPKFDQEYHTFHFGVSFAKNPFGLIHNALGAWRSMVVEGFGNYRPIGRPVIEISPAPVVIEAPLSISTPPVMFVVVPPGLSPIRITWPPEVVTLP
jgi:hypothetical protein